MMFDSIEQAIILTESLPHKMIKNCMLFLMRENIKTNVGKMTQIVKVVVFSYKVSNKIVT